MTDQTGTATGETPEAPNRHQSEYLAARAEWDDRFAGQRKTVRVLAGITFLALVLGSLGMGYGIYTGTHKQLIPFMVQVDELGRSELAPPPQRVALASIFLFIINLGDYGDLVIQSAEALLDVSMQDANLDVIDLYNRLMRLVFELLGRTWYSAADKVAAFAILIVGSMLLGLIVTAYIEVYIAFAAAIVALGFAGWSGTRDIVVRFLKYAAAKVMGLFVALFCGVLISQLVTLELNEESGSAVLLTGLLAIPGLIMLTAPPAMEQAMTGRPGTSAASKMAGLIAGATLWAVGRFVFARTKPKRKRKGKP